MIAMLELIGDILTTAIIGALMYIIFDEAWQRVRGRRGFQVGYTAGQEDALRLLRQVLKEAKDDHN